MPGNSRFAVSLHILAYLVYRAGTAVPSAEIAASVDTNPVVIRRLLSALAKSGFVSAHKGATGGFAIAAAPDAITLLDVYRAVEPAPDQGLRHFTPNPGCPVGARMERILQRVLGQAQAGMEAALRQVTLADMHAQIGAGTPAPTLRPARAS